MAKAWNISHSIDRPKASQRDQTSKSKTDSGVVSYQRTVTEVLENTVYFAGCLCERRAFFHLIN